MTRDEFLNRWRGNAHPTSTNFGDFGAEFDALVRVAVEAEREACARVCAELADRWGKRASDLEVDGDKSLVAKTWLLAAALEAAYGKIRARGDA